MKKNLNWGIKTRLMICAVMPITLMFCSVLFYSYYSRSADGKAELDMRGNLVASVLAQSSEYAVVSGNRTDLDRLIKHVLQSDKSIAAIAVMNFKKEMLVQLHGEVELNAENNRQFVEPIKRQTLAINFYEEDPPHLSSSVGNVTSPAEILGYVRVTMSPIMAIAKQNHQILIESITAATVLLISAVVGMLLALSLIKPLGRTIRVLHQIGSGNYDVSLEITDGGEISELQAAVNEMATSLNQYKNDMEGQIAIRTTALQKAFDAANKAATEKRRLIQNANAAVEEERKSIALDIHDHLNASLIVIRLEAQRIHAISGKGCTCVVSTAINKNADSIIENASSLYEMARNIVKRLRPEVIDTLGLRDAAEEMVLSYDASHVYCKFVFNSTGDLTGIDGELAMVAYRLIQEALANVVKHAEATICSVNLNVRQEDRTLEVTIIDNGIGFDPDQIEPGIGLLGMRERVYGVDGDMTMTTSPNVGTKIMFALPQNPF